MLRSVLGSVLLLACAEAAPRDPLDFVPPDAAVVAQVHAPSLVRSRLVREHLLGGAPGRQLDELTRACGYDPLPKVDRVTIAMVPQGVVRGEFAAIVEGRLDHARLAGCARTLAKARGESLRTTMWSGAAVLRQPGSAGAIALVDGTPPVVLLGEGRLVRAMLRQERSGAPSIRGANDVIDVLGTLGEERPLRVVVRPTDALRAEARARLSGALAPLADVRVLGIGVSVAARFDVTLLGRLPDAGAARRLARTVEQAVERAEEEPLLDLTSFGAPLRSFAVETRGRDVVGVVSVTERQLEAIERDLEDAARRP